MASQPYTSKTNYAFIVDTENVKIRLMAQPPGQFRLAAFELQVWMMDKARGGWLPMQTIPISRFQALGMASGIVDAMKWIEEKEANVVAP